jgi:cytochrome c oxidase subunit 3
MTMPSPRLIPDASAELPARLPSDVRQQLGGTLFLGSLLVFFVTSVLLYAIYAWARRDDPQSDAPLPISFLASTVLLIAISGLVHLSTRTVRRDKSGLTCLLLTISGLAAIGFMGIQFHAMNEMLGGRALEAGTGHGVAGMVAVLAFLHALHVAGGVIALAIVSPRCLMGKYDHERHWPVDFAAQYWHFLDLVWLCMLVAFWSTSGGFVG